MKLLISLMFVILFSCGRSNTDGSPAKKVTPLCPDNSLTCGPEMADWTINSSSVNFPKKYMIIFNDSMKAGNCRMTDLFKTTTESGRTFIKFRLPFIPKERLKIEIIDRGEYCTNNAIFHSEDSVTYRVITLTVERKKSYSVSANLNN